MKPEDGNGDESTSNWIQGVGYIEPVSEIHRLNFMKPGIIDKSLHSLGDHVSKGDILMVQRNSEEAATVALAESKRVVARAELSKVLAGVNPHEIHAKQQSLQSVTADVEYAQRHYNRLHKLLQTEAATTADHDLAESTLRSALAKQRQIEAEVELLKNIVRQEDRLLAEARVVQAEQELALARIKMENTILRAPFNGTIVEVLHREGELTQSSGVLEPVLLLADLSRLRVRAEISDNYVSQVQPGQPAIIFGRGLGGREIPATVKFVKNVMGQKTVFAKTATERKDVDIIQLFIEPITDMTAPLGLEVDVRVNVSYH